MLKKGNRANTLHGILLIALFSFAAFYIADIPVVKKLSFSPLIVGIVLGMLYANSLRNRLPETWVPGIRFCTKQVLRWGIILYGFRLTLAQVAAVGVPAVVVDLIVVTVTILGGVLLGRLLKIDRDTALMTSTGSAICGAAAVLDVKAGYYECPSCHAVFVPTMAQYVKGLHTLTRRRLTCPGCGRTSMCRHRIVR